MNTIVKAFIILISLFYWSKAYCQQQFYISFTPFDKTIIAGKDSKANGYYNHYRDEIIYTTQSQSKINRQLLDTNFIVKKSYSISDKGISITTAKRKALFLTEFSTQTANYEVYLSKKSVELIKLDFEKQTDVIVTSFPLKKYYDDEIVLGITPYNSSLLLLTYTPIAGKILCYEYIFTSNVINYREFALPKMPLTEEKISERGEHLAVNYTKKFESNLYIAPLKNTDRFKIHTETQLFYEGDKLFFLFSMPYKAGYHLLEINVNTSKVSYKNYIVNKYKGGVPGANTEMLPVATIYDSLLVVQNSNYTNLEYHFFNIFTKQFLKKYSATTDSSFSNIVHSKLMQAGTFNAREEEVEYEKVRKFLKKKNNGLLFLKVYKDVNDSLIITFGSYVPTEGAEGLGLFLLTDFILPIKGISSFLVPRIYTARNKFLYASSTFDSRTLLPATKGTKISTTIDKFVNDKIIDDLETPSSFLFEMKGFVYIGVFNKPKNEYDVYKY